MNTIFDLAGPADLELLAGMMREFYAHEELPIDLDRARAALAQLVGDPALGRVWVMRRGGEPIGYLVLALGFSLEFGGRDAFVDELYVREGHRGGGIGRAALEHASAACRALGVRALHLEVERKNEAAQAFYRRLGFLDHDRFLLTRWIDEAEH